MGMETTAPHVLKARLAPRPEARLARRGLSAAAGSGRFDNGAPEPVTCAFASARTTSPAARLGQIVATGRPATTKRPGLCSR